MTHHHSQIENSKKYSAQKPEERLSNIPLLFDELNLSELSDEQLTLISHIDACLPQTQCGLCDHADGCLPYAHAIVTKNEFYNKCVPGGQPVTDQISQIINNTIIGNDIPLTAVPSKWQLDTATNRPQELRAIIIEDDCIGCTKCIPACPVDAIIGTGKHMHTIFTELCTGCELCIAPCPVDCIELVPINRLLVDNEREMEQNHLRNRYHTHLNRVTKQMQDNRNPKPLINAIQSKLSNATNSTIDINEGFAKNTIAGAKLRTKIKKLEKQLTVRNDECKQNELTQLKKQLLQLDGQDKETYNEQANRQRL